jgi:enediyne biosynthesis protein E4
MYRRPLAIMLIVTVSCGNRDKDTVHPSPTTTTGTTTTTTTTTTLTAPATMTQAGVIACADPSARSLGSFERRTAPALPNSGTYLWAAGVISVDFNGDGTMDLYVPGETSHQLWLTTHGTTPMDVTFNDVGVDWVGGLDLDFSVGGTAADLDSDGDMDLVISRWERPNSLLQNEGTHFVDITPPAMLARSHKTQSASLADADGDGDLDLFFGNYGNTPETYDDPTMAAAEPSELYRNDGTGWTDMSDRLGLAVDDAYTFSSGWYDLNGDGLPELMVANDFGKIRPSVLMTNLGDFNFSHNVDWHPNWEDMGMGVADVNGDEQPDVLLSTWKNVDVMTQIATNDDLIWAQAGSTWGFYADFDNRNQAYGWGSDWADFDNDADLDALVLFGHWDAYDGTQNPELQTDAFYEQTSPLVFEQKGSEWGLNDQGPGRGFVTSDLNGDGWLDIAKRQPGQQTPLYLARCGIEDWVRVQLRAPAPNTRAIGAKVRVTHGDKTQIRWITAGSTGMYGGQPPEAHFGLGATASLDKVEVIWPDGAISTFEDVATNQLLTIERP